jgi:hypothetical protein
VARRQICHGKVLARATHGLAEAIVGDIAETVEVAVDKQHGLAQTSAIGRRVCEGDVGAIVQVPGIARPESSDAERFDQGAKIRGRLVADREASGRADPEAVGPIYQRVVVPGKSGF